ncbi:DNA/RNA polymerase [Ramaria rubella]|nr:DNA/RNA polymerase [Ramaria rubella]
MALSVGNDPSGHRVSCATYTQTASPLPFVPESELNNLAAQKTIAENQHLFKIITPINTDRFEQLLHMHPNHPLVDSVCRSLREGRQLDKEGIIFARKQWDAEMAEERFSSPFGPDLLPGMYSTPIGVVPKPHSDKLRLINDQSAGPHSPNSWVAKADMHICLDNLQDFGMSLQYIHRKYGCPPACLFKDDVSSAYRRWPMHFLWQIKQIITIDGMRHVNQCMEFGGCGSARIWCLLMGLVVWIAIHVKRIEDLLHYMDDTWSYDINPKLVYYAPYDNHYPSKQVRLLQLWDEIGLLHEKSKQVFGRTLQIIGFDVDPAAMTLIMPQYSKSDLIAAIQAFVGPSGSCHHPLIEWQHLIGWINWALNSFPLLHPGLQTSYAKSAGKSLPRTSVYLNCEVVADLTWIADTMEYADGVCILTAIEWLPCQADLTIYCDASMSGLGFYIPELNLGFYSSIPNDTAMCNIFFYEASTVVSALLVCTERPTPPQRLLIYTDSLDSVEMFHSLRARTGYNNILLFTVRLLTQTHISLRVFHIPGVENTVADVLLRGLLQFIVALHPGLKIRLFQPPQDVLGATQL